MWLLSKECQDLLHDNHATNLLNHPHVIRAAFRAQRETELGGKLAEAVSRHLAKHPRSTPNQIAEAVGVDPGFTAWDQAVRSGSFRHRGGGERCHLNFQRRDSWR